ncbi:MAG TPA: hypothetical protein VJC03_04815 [bacterium]|nr:hypothetical protein [bacterium]
MIQNVLERKLKWKEAGMELKLGLRQIEYICARVRKESNRGVIHRKKKREEKGTGAILKEVARHIFKQGSLGS